MDIFIEKKQKIPRLQLTKQKYFIAIGVVLLIVIFFALKYLWFLSQADYGVDAKTLNFGEVKKGNFKVSVRGTGTLVPDNVQWLTAITDATVVRRVLKAGNKVKEGDLIVELTNPQLVQQLAEAEFEFEALRAQLKAEKVDQESSIQEQKSVVSNSELDYKASQNEFGARERLIKTGAVSQLDYQRSQTTMEQSLQRWILQKEVYAKMQENLATQNEARTARLNQSKKMLERIQQQVDALQVRATITGTILEVPLESGRRIVMGENIAKLAQEDSLIAELKIPEIQIRDVSVGQKVIVDTRNSVINGVVTRVDPAVVNGSVQVDVAFTGELPSDVRPDLAVDGEIMITELADTLHVERPLFAQSQGMISVYKVSDDGHFAERVEVKSGFGSVNQIQIVGGLNTGDRIIISDPSRFQAYNKIRIN